MRHMKIPVLEDEPGIGIGIQFWKWRDGDRYRDPGFSKVGIRDGIEGIGIQSGFVQNPNFLVKRDTNFMEKAV